MPSCTALMSPGSRPATSIRVGNMSSVPAGKFDTRGSTWPGHSMMPGTRIPPSLSELLKPRRCPVESGFTPGYSFPAEFVTVNVGRPPLSLQNQTRVLPAIPKSLRPWRRAPMDLSMATISPWWAREASDRSPNAFMSSSRASNVRWGEAYQIMTKAGLSCLCASPMNRRASSTRISDPSPSMRSGVPLRLSSGSRLN